MPNAKIIERIKKLLELASSANESDNERILAMNRAQELMVKYSIEESGLDSESNDLPIVYVTYEHETFRKQGVLEVIPGIISVITPIFGVYGVVTRDGYGNIKEYKLVGFQNNIEIAKYALDSLLTQGLITARKEYKKFRTITFGLSFWTGYYMGLTEKFTPASEKSKGVILYDKVAAWLRERTQGEVSPNLSDGIARGIGYEAGLSAEIRKAVVSGDGGKLIG